MIGARSWGRGWLIASGLSVMLHSAAVAALIWQPDRPAARPETPLGELRLEIAGPAITDPSQDNEAGTAPILTSLAEPQTDPDAAPFSSSESLLSTILPGADLATSRSAILEDQAGPPETVFLPATDTSVAPPDPRISALFERIRSRLAEPCLLALPVRSGDDQIQLNVMAAEDRKISLLMRDLTQDIDFEITEQAVLLDRRQCPALDFARRDPGYPLPGIALQLDAQDISSGGNLGGRITGAAGYHITFLLIDDNGTVHDLRRFLIGSAAGSRFDIPIARDGQARDTHQLLLAIATTDRLQNVSRHNGELAEDFLANIAQETGSQPRIGIATVYLR